MMDMMHCKACPYFEGCPVRIGDPEGCCLGSYSADPGCRNCKQRIECRAITNLKPVVLLDEKLELDETP